MLVTLPLYVLRELGRNLFPALIIYTFVVMPFFLFQMLRQNVDTWTVVSITPLVFPFIAGYVLPPAILTGTVMAYGRLGADNEYGAALAGGVWPGWVMLPALAVGVLASSISLYLNESVLTASAHRIGQILVEGQVAQIERQLDRRGVVQFGRRHIYRFPEDADGRQGLDFTEYEETPEPDDPADLIRRPALRYDRPAMRIVARDHKIEVRREERDGRAYNVVEFLLWDCHMAYMNPDGGTRVLAADATVWPVDVKADLDVRIGPDRVQCWGISKILREMRERRRMWAEQRVAWEPRLQAPAEETRRAAGINLDLYRKNFENSMDKYRRELHSRLALSFACVLFALVGTALGLILEHDARSVRFAAGFATAALYFIFFVLCRALSEFGGWVLWMPNLVLASVTLVLWRRMIWAS